MSLSIREFAERKGVSHTAVRKAIERGEVVREPDGTVDPAKNADWTPRPRLVHAEQEAKQGIRTPDIRHSKALQEAYKARMLRIEYEKAMGSLVSADEVKVSIFSQARRVRDRLLQIPRQLAPLLAAETDVAAIEQMLDDAIHDALHELTKGLAT